LRSTLRARGINPDDAAKLIETQRETIYRWLSGSMVPTHAMAVRLEDEFGIGHRLWLVEVARK
jgi:plasmid maintenance system antidote protein VapI